MDPLTMAGLSALGGGGGGMPSGGFSGSSSASLSSQNRISTGAKTVGGLNFAPKNSNVLTIGLIGAVVLAGIYLWKKK